jgi:DNA-binding NarL/FixJ family response regulator
VRVVIADDEALLCEGLAMMLGAAGHDVVARAGTAPELVRLACAHRPDLVVTDIRMPPRHADDGLRAAIEIRATLPSTAVVVLSQYVQRRYVEELLEAGSSGVGYLLKQRVVNAAGFCRDVARVGEGGTALDPEVVAAMFAAARHGDAALDGLTARQAEVLALVAEGRTNAGIARRLRISEKAVVQHVSHIYDQLGLAPSDDDHRRVLVVVRYLTR